MVYSTLLALKKKLSKLGCKEVIIKLLATNQDNEKNQICFGYSNELLSVLPSKINFRTPSESREKSLSKVGKPIIEHTFNFYWLTENSEPAFAPKAKIIDYFQYPEMRFSGFLSGCSNPPDALRRDSQDLYGRRVLVFGIGENEVYGVVLTDEDCNFINELIAMPYWSNSSIFKQLKLDSNVLIQHSPDQLLKELRDIGSEKKYESMVLRNLESNPEPFQGTQGAGWTLEALLGIPRNSSGMPDKYGFEIKTFLSTTITLLTTEPDFGFRYEKGLTAFLNKYGWHGTKNDGSHRFNGKHNTLEINRKSKLKLEIENWDFEANLPKGSGEPNILLLDDEKEEIAAGWSFNKIAEKWGRKHAGAMYVSAHKYKFRQSTFATHYSFGKDVYCGQGTSAILFLKSLAIGVVYLDPGDKVTNLGVEKKRTQWRIRKGRGTNFSSTLAALYDQMQTFQI